MNESYWDIPNRPGTDFPALRSAAMAKLAEMGHADKVKFLKYAANSRELHSSLREYIFHDDAKTTEFLNSVQAAMVSDQLLSQP
jgi:hypothetical protein